MCGIAGSISALNENRHDFVENMLRKIRHRGPDGSGIIKAGPAILGHQRLAILDLSTHANQPMWDSNKRHYLVFNGEIYNFGALREELSQLGHQFNTRSDTEVLLNAWMEWGIKSLSKFVGMFAFAIWDTAEQTLIMARDRMGEKPLFYSGFHENFEKGLIFSSELKSLIEHPAIPKKISLSAISEFLSQNYLLTDTCIFENIHKLPPAHYLIYQLDQKPIIKCYWELKRFFHEKNHTISFNEAKEQFNHLIKTATTQQSYADVKVGAFLSGGIDSSTIVAQMAQQNSNNVHTFSIGFSEKSYNELPASMITAEHLKVSHKTKIVHPQIQELLPKLAYMFDEPFADTSMIPTYLLAEFAREFVKVSLSGDGGDELFGGYVTYQADRLHQHISKFPKFILKTLQQIIYLSPTSFSKISLDYKLKQFIQGCLHDYPAAHVSWRTIFSINEKIKLFHPEFHEIAKINPFDKIQPYFEEVKNCNPLDQAMYVDMKTWLVDDILVKVDRASMAHSLEVRAPFLDHNIVEFAASLPVHYKIAGRRGKHIIKESQKDFLPKTIRVRKKEGFNSPISIWLNNELYDLAYSLTTSNKLLRWFEKSSIESLWKQHKNHIHDHGYKLFGLLNLALWLEEFNL